MRLNSEDLLPQIIRDQNGISRYVSLEQVFMFHFLKFNNIVINGDLSNIQVEAIGSIPTIFNNVPLNRINELTFVKKLCLKNVNINNKRIEEIFPTIIFMRTEKLSLSENNLTSANSIKLNPSSSLVFLNLSNNKIKGVKTFCEYLKDNNSLKYLDLSENQININGARELGKVLKKNITLEQLNLAFNDIESYGFQYIVNGICECQKTKKSGLKYLNVIYNNISELPINLGYLTSITKFMYSPEEIMGTVPEVVVRWLMNYERFNENYLDRQNVHDRRINKSLIDSIYKLENAIKNNLLSINEMHIRINNDTILEKTVKELLKEKCKDQNIYSVMDKTFEQLLQIAFSRIESLESKELADEIKKRINEEIKEAVGMCFVGWVNRLFNSFCGLDSLVKVVIINPNDLFISVGQDLIKNKEYSIEKHKQEFEKEITENNMTLDDLTKKGFYDNIEIFYETYGDEDLQPSAKRQKK
tara:strand:+ start:1061 stop:2479 length:1419 start_codon:yes stop_codon:yes gene_type:complete